MSVGLYELIAVGKCGIGNKGNEVGEGVGVLFAHVGAERDAGVGELSELGVDARVKIGCREGKNRDGADFWDNVEFEKRRVVGGAVGFGRKFEVGVGDGFGEAGQERGD